MSEVIEVNEVSEAPLRLESALSLKSFRCSCYSHIACAAEVLQILDLPHLSSVADIEPRT